MGLLVDDLNLPSWAYRAVEHVVQSDIADVVVVVVNAEEKRQSAWSKFKHRLEHFLYYVYLRLDRLVYPPETDAFAQRDLRTLLPKCEVVEVSATHRGFGEYFEAHDLERFKSYSLDVAVRFGFGILRGDVLRVPRLGIWSYHHGDNTVKRGTPAGVWEVVEGDRVLGTILQQLNDELDGGRTLYRSFGFVDQNSIGRGNNRSYWKSAPFIARALQDQVQLAAGAQDASFEFSLYSHPLYHHPGNVTMARTLTGMGYRLAKSKVRSLLYEDDWSLAYALGPNIPPMYRFKYVMPPAGTSWADPFPVEHQGKNWVFLEEAAGGSGHISVMETESGRPTGRTRTVLAPGYHLSYPFVFQWQGTWFMLPESSDNRTIELYRCREFPDAWELEAVLMKDIIAADSTLAFIEDSWWMFTCIAEPGALATDELYVFRSDSPLGPWKAHRRNPVKSDARSARPAGAAFKWNGGWYRPSQDCSVRYGYGVSINKIVSLSLDSYEEREVTKIIPAWDRRVTAAHTFNRSGALTVIDCRVRRSRFLGDR